MINKYNNVLFNLKKDKKYILDYESEQSGLKKDFKGKFKKVSQYIIETSDYFESEYVKKAKEDGILTNGKSGVNEVSIVPFIYLNVNTKKIKLRVPVLSSKVIEYFYEGNACSEKTYFEKLTECGWKPKSVVYLWNRFQSFEIDKIKKISPYEE